MSKVAHLRFPGNVPDAVKTHGPGVQKAYIHGYNARTKRPFRGKGSPEELCDKAGWSNVRRRFYLDDGRWHAKKTQVPLKDHYDRSDELPSDVQDLPIYGMKLWAAVYNRSKATSPERRCNEAWAAAKKLYSFYNGKWHYKTRLHGRRRKMADALVKALHERADGTPLELDTKGVTMKSASPKGLDLEWEAEELRRKKRPGYFRVFIPFEMAKKVEGQPSRCRLVKKKDGFHVVGIASSDTLDRDGEIMSAAFVQKMAAMAKGMNVYEEHRYGISHTVGTCSDTELIKDGRAFRAWTHLEPQWDPVREWGNKVVSDIVMKLEHGTTLGYSVAGWVTKVEDVFYQEHGREVPTIMDGELAEYSITSMPSNPDTEDLSMVRAVKSFRGGVDDADGDESGADDDGDEMEEGDEDEFMDKALTHNSKLASDEPKWGGVDKTKLPRGAHAVTGEANKKSTWKYPHHFVRSGGKLSDLGVYTTGDMYCHRGGVIAAWSALMGARSGQRGPQDAIQHVQRHRKALGLEKILAREGAELCVKCSAEYVLKNTDALEDFCGAVARLVKGVDTRALDERQMASLKNAISDSASHIGSELIGKVLSDLFGQEPYQQ